MSDFRNGLESVGLIDVSLTATHTVADGMVSAIVKATRPVGLARSAGLAKRVELPMAQACGCGEGGCC